MFSYCSLLSFLLFVFLFVHPLIVVMLFLFFFFKQNTAYELRISDWRSDVCSSDLVHRVAGFAIALVAVLADPSGDVNQVALAQISGALCQLAEERHTVPVRIGLPFIAILAVVVRGDGNVG